MSPFPLPGVLAAWLVVALVVVLVLFALAIVFAAVWYHFRQEKEVRMDPDEDAPADEWISEDAEGPTR